MLPPLPLRPSPAAAMRRALPPLRALRRAGLCGAPAAEGSGSKVSGGRGGAAGRPSCPGSAQDWAGSAGGLKAYGASRSETGTVSAGRGRPAPEGAAGLGRAERPFSLPGVSPGRRDRRSPVPPGTGEAVAGMSPSGVGFGVMRYQGERWGVGAIALGESPGLHAVPFAVACLFCREGRVPL